MHQMQTELTKIALDLVYTEIVRIEPNWMKQHDWLIKSLIIFSGMT